MKLIAKVQVELKNISIEYLSYICFCNFLHIGIGLFEYDDALDLT